MKQYIVIQFGENGKEKKLCEPTSFERAEFIRNMNRDAYILTVDVKAKRNGRK